METIERTRTTKSGNDIERLRAQNALLLAAIASASAAMTAAPNWHEAHRNAHKTLQVALGKVDVATQAQVPPLRTA